MRRSAKHSKRSRRVSTGSGARIAELDKRLHAMAPRVTTLPAGQQRYVQEIAVAALEEQKDRLKSYNAQARFAVAQLYDRARTATEGTHAAAPQ
jgi:TolA-binding protein